MLLMTATVIAIDHPPLLIRINRRHWGYRGWWHNWWAYRGSLLLKGHYGTLHVQAMLEVSVVIASVNTCGDAQQ